MPNPSNYPASWWTAIAICATAAAYAIANQEAEAATLGAHVYTYHPTRHDLNNVNPGVYYVSDSGWGGGYYKNTIKRDSVHLDYTACNGPACLSMGVVTGYRKTLFKPLFVPSYAFGPVRVSVLPTMIAPGVHFSVERGF